VFACAFMLLRTISEHFPQFPDANGDAERTASLLKVPNEGIGQVEHSQIALRLLGISVAFQREDIIDLPVQNFFVLDPHPQQLC
jgi:hypothetical protein